MGAAKLFPYTSSNEAYLTFWQAARTHRHICEPDMACSFQIGFFVIFATIKTALESLLPLSVQTIVYPSKHVIKREYFGVRPLAT